MSQHACLNGGTNPIGALQERFQSHGIVPIYQVVHVEGTNHSPTFSVKVSVGKLTATGTGGSKKQAKHAAAKAVVDQLDSQVSSRDRRQTLLPSPENNGPAIPAEALQDQSVGQPSSSTEDKELLASMAHLNMDACGEPMVPDLGPSRVMGGGGPNTVTLEVRSEQATALPKRTVGGEGYKASRSNSGGQTDMSAEEDPQAQTARVGSDIEVRETGPQAHTAGVSTDRWIRDPPRFGHQACPDLWIGVYDRDFYLSCTYSSEK